MRGSEHRLVAQTALARFGIEGAQLSLLSCHRKAIYQVLAGNDRFVLRVCPPGLRRLEVLESEPVWLAAIRLDTGLGVPTPVVSPQGAYVEAVYVNDSPEVWFCLLFEWLEGRFMDAGLKPRHLRLVGGLLASLHRQAEHFAPPPHFVRPRHDWTELFRGGSVFEASTSPFTAHQSALFTAAGKRISSELGALTPSPEEYGLIHGDLQQTNYLFYKREVRAIDFDDCAWGYFSFDMAITLFEIADRPCGPAMRDAFLDGYTTVRPLPRDHDRRIELFTAVRLLKRINYLTRADNRALRARAPEWVDYSEKWLEKYLQTA
jgi:Ser/Thr protein kinase RdoA (MazF antagonist)